MGVVVPLVGTGVFPGATGWFCVAIGPVDEGLAFGSAVGEQAARPNAMVKASTAHIHAFFIFLGTSL